MKNFLNPKRGNEIAGIVPQHRLLEYAYLSQMGLDSNDILRMFKIDNQIKTIGNKLDEEKVIPHLPDNYFNEGLSKVLYLAHCELEGKLISPQERLQRELAICRRFHELLTSKGYTLAEVSPELYTETFERQGVRAADLYINHIPKTFIDEIIAELKKIDPDLFFRPDILISENQVTKFHTYFFERDEACYKAERYVLKEVRNVLSDSDYDLFLKILCCTDINEEGKIIFPPQQIDQTKDTLEWLKKVGKITSRGYQQYMVDNIGAFNDPLDGMLGDPLYRDLVMQAIDEEILKPHEMVAEFGEAIRIIVSRFLGPAGKKEKLRRCIGLIERNLKEGNGKKTRKFLYKRIVQLANEGHDPDEILALIHKALAE